jgi:hypothetical protein
MISFSLKQGSHTGIVCAAIDGSKKLTALYYL